jgi:hypothetical protein
MTLNFKLFMPIEIVILIVLAVAVLTAYLVLWKLNRDDETAQAVAWANRKTPIIIEQRFVGSEWKLRSIEEAETARRRLKEHGNPYSVQVILWIHNSDTQNTALDFEEWQWGNVKRRERIYANFFKEKAENAKRAGDVDGAARLFSMAEIADFERNQNGEYE